MNSNNKCTDTALGYFPTVQMTKSMININHEPPWKLKISNKRFSNTELKKHFVYQEYGTWTERPFCLLTVWNMNSLNIDNFYCCPLSVHYIVCFWKVFLVYTCYDLLCTQDLGLKDCSSRFGNDGLSLGGVRSARIQQNGSNKCTTGCCLKLQQWQTSNWAEYHPKD
jgi:hypothetical protein